MRCQDVSLYSVEVSRVSVDSMKGHENLRIVGFLAENCNRGLPYMQEQWHSLDSDTKFMLIYVGKGKKGKVVPVLN
jgi:hypothetical protein